MDMVSVVVGVVFVVMGSFLYQEVVLVVNRSFFGGVIQGTGSGSGYLFLNVVVLEEDKAVVI